MITILVVSALLVLIGLLLSDSFIEIPAYHFGVVERFGKRIDTILYEGLCIKLPFIDSVELISTELVEIDVPANFTTQDKLQLTCNGSLQYRPDPLVKRKGKCVFVEMSEEIIKSGIEDTIKAKMGALGGIRMEKILSRFVMLFRICLIVFFVWRSRHIKSMIKKLARYVVNIMKKPARYVLLQKMKKRNAVCLYQKEKI